MFTPDILIRRAEILRAMRAYFDGLGFVEVETAVRIAAPAPEPHIDCPLAPIVDFSTPNPQPPTSNSQPPTPNPQPPTPNSQPPTFNTQLSTFNSQPSACRYLRASPELQMKKLLAAGMDRIYQIGPCFREGERGARHNPEFTMIEWYRRGEDYRKIAEDLKGLLNVLGDDMCRMKVRPSSDTANTGRSGGVPCRYVELTVRDAYLRYAGWDPWAEWDQDRFDFDMATKIEPALKTMGAVFLIDYPPQAASLARISELRAERKSQISNCKLQNGDGKLQNGDSGLQNGDSGLQNGDGGLQNGDGGLQNGDGGLQNGGCGSQSAICNLQSEIRQVAERWEFYWNGLELANCFTELCDADEQRRRFVAARAERRALGEADYPLDERFLETLPQIGSAAGVALGVDRLVMVLTGAKDIASVRAPE